MKAAVNGLATGLIFQLAIGPVFFFIINLAIQRTVFDGFAAVLGVTIVDYFYITLSILGIGKLLENKRIKKSFGIISSIVLIIFGVIILREITNIGIPSATIINSQNLLSSFTSAFFLTLSNPMTIIFFTSIVGAKAVEYNFTRRQLPFFGFGIGLATLLFMGANVMLFSLIKGTIPVLLIQILNLGVGLLLIGYGGIRLFKTL